MHQRVLVVSASRYSFEDEKNASRRIEGAKLSMIQDKKDTPDRKGPAIVNVDGPYSLFSEITSVPGIYEVVLGLAPAKDGKATVRAESARLLEPVDLVVPQESTPEPARKAS